MLTDPRGLHLTATSVESIMRLEATITAYCAFRKDTGDRLKEALAADPQLVMGHVLRGYFMLLLVKRELVARARQAAEAADRAIAAQGVTPREALHRQALDAWINRDQLRAIEIFEAILAEYPRDILALKLAQYLLFYIGDSKRMRGTVERAMASWDETQPCYGFVLGCHAFGLEECGDYDAAERTGRSAVELIPQDIWGAHAVAHVFEMRERTDEGLSWIQTHAPQWEASNNFVFHVWWHRCLLLLKLRRYDEVLARYDSEVRAESTDEHLDVTNAVALLWRLEQAGVDVGRRWDELARRAAARIEDHMTVFGDAHFAMALAAAGTPAEFSRWQDSARAYAAGSSETQASVMAEVGLALGEAASAHRRGDFVRALDRLMPLRHAIQNIGGSHAQRDLFTQLLIDSAVKSHRREVARVLLDERITARPGNGWALDQLHLIETRA